MRRGSCSGSIAAARAAASSYRLPAPLRHRRAAPAVAPRDGDRRVRAALAACSTCDGARHDGARFVVKRDHPQYAGKLTIDEQAEVHRDARAGRSARRRTISSARASRSSRTASSILPRTARRRRVAARAVAATPFRLTRRAGDRCHPRESADPASCCRTTLGPAFAGRHERDVATAVDVIVSPVTYGASASRKWTAFAMSSGVPSRRSGVCEMIRWRDSSSNASSSGHRIGPGRDGVDAHLRRELARERARQPHESRLGDRVHDVALERALGVDVGDVDDRALRLASARVRRPATGTAAPAGSCRSGRPSRRP